MTRPVDQALGLVSQLAGHKRMATGAALGDASEIGRAYASSFDDFVSAIYRWYWESIQQDREFLQGIADRAQRAGLTEFSTALRDQRHDRQHDDYDRAAEARTWRDQVIARGARGIDSDATLRAAMLVELMSTLQILCAIAQRASRNPRESQAWSDRLAATPEQQVRFVYQNLGLRPPQNLDLVVRRYTGHPGRTRSRNETQRARVAEAVVLGTDLTPLSMDYDELLDEFGLVGDPAAKAFLLLAHGVECSGHTNASTVSILEKVWPIVSATS